MKRLFATLIFSCWIFNVYGQEGVISSGSKVPTDQAILSQADWYTAKRVIISGISGTVLTISTTYPGYLLKGFYNPRRDSSVYVNGITSIGDTIKISIPTESFSGKLPIIAKVIKSGSSDSTIYLFQKR